MKKRLLNKFNIGYMIYYDEFIKNFFNKKIARSLRLLQVGDELLFCKKIEKRICL